MFAVFFSPYLDTSCDLGGRWLTSTLSGAKSGLQVLTLLPRSVFQVFSSCQRGGDREKRDSIYNSFRSVISVCVHPNASHYLIATKA